MPCNVIRHSINGADCGGTASRRTPVAGDVAWMIAAATASRLPHVTVILIFSIRCVCPASLSSVEWQGPMREGNPHFANRMQVYCDTGFYLAILPDSQVKGVDEDSDKYTVIDVLSVGVGEVRLRGVESKLYLAMDDKGLLYGETDPGESATIFIADHLDQYNMYQSKKHGWYVGIRKNGTAKPGPHTKRGQKAVKFLPIREDV